MLDVVICGDRCGDRARSALKGWKQCHHHSFTEGPEPVHGQSRGLSVRGFMIWHSLLRGGPLELDLMSVAKLQVSLVRLVRSTILESLPACLFMD